MTNQSDASASADRATHERSRQVVSAVPVGIPSAHTPGPWSVSGAFGLDRLWVGANYGCINGLSARFTLASVLFPDESEVGYTDGAFNSETAIANARLISAVPDFADVAPDAADILEHYAEYARGLPSAEFECHPYIPAIEEAAAKLRAALAKAGAA